MHRLLFRARIRKAEERLAFRNIVFPSTWACRRNNTKTKHLLLICMWYLNLLISSSTLKVDFLECYIPMFVTSFEKSFPDISDSRNVITSIFTFFLLHFYSHEDGLFS